MNNYIKKHTIFYDGILNKEEDCSRIPCDKRIAGMIDKLTNIYIKRDLKWYKYYKTNNFIFTDCVTRIRYKVNVIEGIIEEYNK